MTTMYTIEFFHGDTLHRAAFLVGEERTSSKIYPTCTARVERASGRDMTGNWIWTPVMRNDPQFQAVLLNATFLMALDRANAQRAEAPSGV